jgi:hypothetical protein
MIPMKIPCFCRGMRQCQKQLQMLQTRWEEAFLQIHFVTAAINYIITINSPPPPTHTRSCIRRKFVYIATMHCCKIWTTTYSSVSPSWMSSQGSLSHSTVLYFHTFYTFPHVFIQGSSVRSSMVGWGTMLWVKKTRVQFRSHWIFQ